MVRSLTASCAHHSSAGAAFCFISAVTSRSHSRNGPVSRSPASPDSHPHSRLGLPPVSLVTALPLLSRPDSDTPNPAALPLLPSSIPNTSNLVPRLGRAP
eukprot:scaffold34228_cov79-Isochrysis_galbana.AAC.2